MPLENIAKRAGYGSVEAFGRAFKDAYDKSPTDYRATGSHMAFKTAHRAQDATGFAVTVEQMPETRCAGVSHKGSYMEIDRAMGRLFDGLAAHGLLKQDSRMLALFFDDPDIGPVDQLRSVACSPVGPESELPPSVEETTLRGGLHARLRYRGPYADMKDAYRWLLGVWLPDSGYAAADAPMVEEYLNNPRDVPPADLLTYIRLPLETPNE